VAIQRVSSPLPPRVQNDRFSVSTDGFMLNLSSVLLQACQPFTDGIKDEKVRFRFRFLILFHCFIFFFLYIYVNYNLYQIWYFIQLLNYLFIVILIYCSVLHQIKRIDGSYYQFTQRLDTSQETKLSASLEAVNAWVNARRSQAEVEQGLPPLVDDSEPADQGDKGKEKERPAKKGLPNKLLRVSYCVCCVGFMIVFLFN
jgi:hypothetical protein